MNELFSNRATGEVTSASTDTRIDLAGLTPIGVRFDENGVRLQWRIQSRIVETDLDRFRPVRLTQAPRTRELAVVWRDLGELATTDPFFRGTLEKASLGLAHAGVFATHWSVLPQLIGNPANLPFAGVIFHMARVGSTLVHRLLSRTGVVSSLSEIGFYDRILLATKDWPTERRNAVLRGAVAAYSRPRRQSERHLVIKMTDAVPNTHLGLFRLAFPEVPWIFIFRDPVEVMVSLLREPSGTFRDWQRNPRLLADRLGMPALVDPNMSIEEFTARTLRRFCADVVEAAKATPAGRFLAVSYRRLPDAVWETIAPHFGITLSSQDCEAMRQEARYSAKHKQTLEFAADSDAKRAEASAKVLCLAERYVAPMIDELRALPQG